MSSDVIEMMRSPRGATELDVARFERVNNLALPKSYRRFLSEQNGGRPRDGEFPVPGWGVTVVDTFFGIGTGDSYDLQRQLDHLADSRNIDLLPIATDPGGLLLFLGIRGPHVGSIFFWDHKDAASQPVQVGDDFEAFAALLKPEGAFDSYEFGCRRRILHEASRAARGIPFETLQTTMKLPDDLSHSLQQIAQHELARGNEIERIDRPAGSASPLAIVFAKPLDFDGFRKGQRLPPNVRTWSNRDRHYDLEDGYVCDTTHHVLSGPMREN